MCFSAPSSLLAWGFANSIAFYLWQRNKNYDRWNAAFIFTFTLIQLLEAGLWSTDSKDTNQVLTSIIMVALLAQPLVQSYMGWKYTKQPVLQIMTYIFIGLLIWGIFKAGSEKFQSYKGPNSHLVWESEGQSYILQPFTWLYFLGLFIPLLYMGVKGLPLIAIMMATLIYSWMATKGKEFGSMWCFTSVAYALVALFV